MWLTMLQTYAFKIAIAFINNILYIRLLPLQQYMVAGESSVIGRNARSHVEARRTNGIVNVTILSQNSVERIVRSTGQLTWKLRYAMKMHAQVTKCRKIT